jgi:glucose-6-phosphate isomerase
LRERPSWRALKTHHAALRDVHLRSLFSQDSERAERFALEALGFRFDYYKHRITDETLRLLL